MILICAGGAVERGVLGLCGDHFRIERHGARIQVDIAGVSAGILMLKSDDVVSCRQRKLHQAIRPGVPVSGGGHYGFADIRPIDIDRQRPLCCIAIGVPEGDVIITRIGHLSIEGNAGASGFQLVDKPRSGVAGVILVHRGLRVCRSAKKGSILRFVGLAIRIDGAAAFERVSAVAVRSGIGLDIGYIPIHILAHCPAFSRRR